MADLSNLLGALPRAQLAKIFPDPRVRAAFETLFVTVQAQIPDSITELTDTLSEVQGLELISRALATSALVIATRALQSADEGPPLVMASPYVPDDAGPSMLGVLERLAKLEADVSQLSQGPTPL